MTMEPSAITVSLEWADIEGYEGLYKVSNEGDVMRSYKDSRKANKHGRNRILKQFWRGRYLCVELSKNDEQRMFPVSRLVALKSHIEFLSQ